MAHGSAFRCSNGQMFCEKLNLNTILDKLEKQNGTAVSPLFVYSKQQLHENVKAYTDALKEAGCPHQLNFSIKANQNLTLLRELQFLGTSATLVSGNEIRLALEAGFEPSQLMFNGGGKSVWETRLAVQHGLFINVDSEWDLKQTMNVCSQGFEEPKRARVLLRINLNIDPQVHTYVNTGMIDCKFGLSEEAVEVCTQLLEQPDSPVELVGLHSHMGSTIYQTDVFKLCVEKLMNIRQQLLNRGFTNVNILNLGGGLGIDYLRMEPETRPWRRETDKNQSDLLTLRQWLILKAQGAEKEPTVVEVHLRDASSKISPMAHAITNYREERISYSDMKDVLKTMLGCWPEFRKDVERLCPCLLQDQVTHATALGLVRAVSGLFRGTGITLMLEPGRSLVANACVLVAKVLGCKQTANKKYIISDASMTEVIRPCLYGSYHHVTVLGAKSGCSKQVFDVVGPVCESGDFIAKDRILPQPDPENGLIVVHDVGAYCQSMSSNYNARMKPAEVLVTGSSWRLIRRQDSFEDFMAPYRNLD